MFTFTDIKVPRGLVKQETRILKEVASSSYRVENLVDHASSLSSASHILLHLHWAAGFPIHHGTGTVVIMEGNSLNTWNFFYKGYHLMGCYAMWLF
jgi:hypothetical protein